MGRKKVIINPESGKRLSAWLKEANVTQAELAASLHYTQQHISNIATGQKNLGYDLAEYISENIPNREGEHVRIEYLLGKDDFKTDGSRIHAIHETIQKRSDLIEQVIESHHYQISESRSEVKVDDEGREYYGILIEIKAPDGSARYMRPAEFAEFKKNLHDIVEGQLLLKFKMPKDGAKEYWGL